MRIVVCIKQVPDYEAPQESFEINAADLKVKPRGIPPVLSLFDENALEAALQIKEKQKDILISVLTLGKRTSKPLMTRALAAGADELICVEDESFESGYLDSFALSEALSAAIKKIDDCQLILMGRQAADWNDGLAATGVANFLGLPLITLARKVELTGNNVRCERLIEDGYQMVETNLPAIVMVSNEVGALRYPAMKDRREAKNKAVKTWTLQEIEYAPVKKDAVVLRHLRPSMVKQRKCEFILGNTFVEKASNLAQKLYENHFIR